MSEEEINKIIDVYDEVITDLKQENSQLKEIIEKAIEYIEIEGEHTDCSGESIYYLDEEQEEDLLKILKGDKL